MRRPVGPELEKREAFSSCDGPKDRSRSATGAKPHFFRARSPPGAGLRDPSPRSAGQTAIIPPAVVAGLVLVLRSMSLIASGLLVAGQIVGPIAGALVAVVLMKIEPPRAPPQDKAAARRYRIGSIATTAILFTLPLWITALM